MAYSPLGQIGHGPPFGQKYVFLTYKKLGKLGSMAPPFVKALTGLRRLPPPSLEVTAIRNHRTSPTTPPPSKSQNLVDYPPVEVTEPRANYPPSKSQNLADYDYPPLEKFMAPLIEFLNMPLYIVCVILPDIELRTVSTITSGMRGVVILLQLWRPEPKVITQGPIDD